MGNERVFPKRNRTALFWVYFVLKCLVWSAYDAMWIANGSVEGWWSVVWPALTALFGVLSYIVIYYTWKANFCKIGVAAFATDVLAGIAHMTAIFFGHQLFDAVTLGDYRAYFGPNTLVVCGLFLCFFLLLLRIARPLIRWFANYEIVHLRLWQTVVVLSVALLASTRMDYTQHLMSSVLGAMTGLGLLVALLLVIVTQQTTASARRSARSLRKRSGERRPAARVNFGRAALGPRARKRGGGPSPASY